MVSAAERALEPASRSGLRVSLRRLYLRSEAVRAYSLLSPMLLVMLTMLVVPMIGLFILSFWTQVYFDLDRTFTLKNYIDIFRLTDKPFDFWADPFSALANPIYLKLLLKSIRMSVTATIAVVLLAYPR